MATRVDPQVEREHLFKAAYAVMRRSGYSGVTITDILSEAGISTRAFYRHFASKDDLLIAMFRENAALTRQRLADRVAAVDPIEGLGVWIDEILDMGYDERKSRVARMFASNSVRAMLADAGDEAIANLYQPLRLVLEEGARSGAFPTCDPAVDAESIHAIVWRLFLEAMHGRAVLDREGARAHALRFALPALGVGG